VKVNCRLDEPTGRSVVSPLIPVVHGIPSTGAPTAADASRQALSGAADTGWALGTEPSSPRRPPLPQRSRTSLDHGDDLLVRVERPGEIVGIKRPIRP
jgi:hypothetical protein